MGNVNTYSFSVGDQPGDEARRPSGGTHLSINEPVDITTDTATLLQMFEEELYFPGKPVYAKADELVDLDLSGSPPPSHHPSSDSLSPVSSTSTHVSSPLRTEPPFSFSMHGATMGHTPASSRSSLTTPSHTSVASRMGFGRTPLHRVTLPPTLEDDESSINSDQISASQKMTINPRDHSLLEFVYNEMHACRFINLEPLALLKYTIPLYFKGA